MVRMTRRGVFHRPPQIEPDLLVRYHRIPKARWAEMYRDLYAQCYGEDRVQGWMDDAEERSRLLERGLRVELVR